jgi:hypothetical protein
MRDFRHPLVASAALNLAFIIPFINRGISFTEIPYFLLGIIAATYAIYWNMYEPDDDDGLVYKYLVNLLIYSEIIHISPSPHKLAWCIITVLVEITAWVFLNPMNKNSHNYERNTVIWQIIHSTKTFLVAAVIAK